MKLEDVILRDTRANQPAATTVPNGTLYYVTDESVTERSDGTVWQDYSDAGGSGDVIGPASSIASEIALFDGTSGKLIKRSTGTGIVRVASGVYGSPGNVVESEITLADNTTNDVSITKHGFVPKAPNDATKYLDGTGTYTVPPGGGSFTFIEEISPSGVGTFTFSSLGAYIHLRIIYSGRGDQAATSTAVGMQFNGDTGANYDRQIIDGVGSAATAGESLGQTTNLIISLAAATATAGLVGSGEILIPDYRGTTFHKQGNVTANWKTANTASGYHVRLNGFAWRNTNAITSITFTLASGNFVSGTKFSLYGIS